MKASGDGDVLDPDFLLEGGEHGLYRELLREVPVSLRRLPNGNEYYCVARHEDVTAVSRQPELFSSQVKGMLLDDMEGMLPTLLSLDPPAHGEVRRPLIDSFGPRMAAAMEPRVREILRGVFARAAELGECDFVKDLAAPLPLQVICDLLGVPEEDRERVGGWSDGLAGAQDPEFAERLDGKETNQAAMELGMYAFGLGQKLEGGGGGTEIVSRLMRATIGGEPVELPAFAGLFVQMLIGGNETTRSLISGALRELLARPDDYIALESDPTLIPVAVEEMLRWVCPVRYFRRTATAATEIGGVAIPEGSAVVLLYTAANRDGLVFDEPDRFDIRRDPNPHVAFGFGEHFCLGARIARLEARCFFEEFFRHFSRVELAGEPELMRSRELNSLKRMPVRVTAR